MFAVKGTYVIVRADDIRESSAVLIDGDRVSSVVSASELDEMLANGRLSPEDVVDRRGSIIMPGLVDSHMHQYAMIGRGMPMRVTGITEFGSLLQTFWWPYVENRIRTREVRVTSRWVMAQLIRSGVTAFSDILEAPFSESDVLLAQGDEIASAGMRANISLEASERISHEVGEEMLRRDAEAAEHFSSKGSGLVHGVICTHTTFSTPVSMLQEAAALAIEHGCWHQFHLNEGSYEPSWAAEHLGEPSTVALYERMGVLTPHTLAAQCVKLTPEDISIMAASGMHVAHQPISNCEDGAGYSPIPEMLDAGITPGLGTDGYYNDMFAIMRSAFLVHKGTHENTTVMPSNTVFRMATEYGARAIGFPGCGTLEPGQLADFVCYRDIASTPVTRDNLLDQLCVFGSREGVTDVWVAGRRLLESGELTTIDEEQALADMRSCADDFWRDA